MGTNDTAVTAIITSMLLSSEIAKTAIHLAQEAGEAVTRPLSAAQLQRAFDIHNTESARVTSMLFAHLDALPGGDGTD